MSFIFNMLSADKNNKRADEINVKAFNRISKAEQEEKRQETKMNNSLTKLAKRKKAILTTSMNDFINLYERIIKINFIESDGIKEALNHSFTIDNVKEIKEFVNVAGMNLTNGQTIVAMLMPISGGISNVIKKEAELNVGVAQMRSKQARVIESQCETKCVALDAIIQRAERLSQLLTKLNILFIKSIENSNLIINEKGTDRKNYNSSDRDALMSCMNLAGTIKVILDTPLIDKDSKLTQESLKAIEMGNEYINKINLCINS